MDSMHSNSFAIIFMIVLVTAPALAYILARAYGAHEAASDHPVVHHRR